MSRSAYIIFLVIFLVTSFISSVLRFQTPESYRLVYDAIIAIIALTTALFEQTIIRKSVYTFLLFLILPFVFAIVSLVLWLSGASYRDLDLWVSFVYWDSIILFNLLIYSYLLQKKFVK